MFTLLRGYLDYTDVQYVFIRLRILFMNVDDKMLRFFWGARLQCLSPSDARPSPTSVIRMLTLLSGYLNYSTLLYVSIRLRYVIHVYAMSEC